MTYGVFLLVFLVLPILTLGLWLGRCLRRPQLLAMALIGVIAFCYTAPWDNYAASRRLWTFGPNFVWGPPLWFGYLPIEEYLFYIAEAVFVILSLLALRRVQFLHPK